ncbi:MAG: putative colanic acid biosynthesis acetyltransferase [Verrucomicrobiota bacterium]|jgi:putative colanic acid biosynthesis acetyltransferase WcaF
MGLFNAHSPESEDPLLRPVYGWQHRSKRLVWVLAYMFLFRPTPPPMHHWRCFLLRLFGAKLGAINFIYPSARIWAPWLLETGDLVTIGRGAEIYNPGGVSLGHRTIVSQDAYLCGATHDYQSSDFTYITKPIRTEPQVWICARAMVLPGVNCKEGSVLGAGAVASRDLQEWTVYAGNPAAAVRQRMRQQMPGQKPKPVNP